MTREGVRPEQGRRKLLRLLRGGGWNKSPVRSTASLWVARVSECHGPVMDRALATSRASSIRTTDQAMGVQMREIQSQVLKGSSIQLRQVCPRRSV